MDAGAEILDALRADGIATSVDATSTRGPVPGALVLPADPWVEPMKILQRNMQLVTWSVIAVSGRADPGAALSALADLIEAVYWALLRRLAGWSTPAVAAPQTRTVYGADYLCAELRTSRAISIGG